MRVTSISIEASNDAAVREQVCRADVVLGRDAGTGDTAIF
jgi:hypothetical protein